MQLTIDGKQVEFNQGQTIIEAAREAGIKIPHFCWHPGLSISGNCRICLVEIEKMPKLVIACSTQAADGMVVFTKSEKVIKAQNAVMEFLLINHPLDCPICDEAGECKLQDYAYKYSTGTSRFDEEKNHKNKRVELGPNVMFDQERCISCSRCIRFCEEVAKNPQLTFVNRGEKVTIETFPGKKLDDPYSMNVVEICPVGALTSKHFRFKSRVWDMSFTDSICPGCSRGCNTTIGVRNNEILRIEPKENQEVNQWWLCDYGRLETIKNINDNDVRINSPYVKGQPVDWETANTKAIELLKENTNKILFIASAISTTEDNYTLNKFRNAFAPDSSIVYIPNIDNTFEDDILKKADKTPNANGLKLLGITPADDAILTKIKNKDFKLAVVLNEDITYINHDNRIQRLKAAVATKEQERLLGEFELSRLDKFGAHNDSWTKGKIFDSKPGWKIIKEIADNFDYKFEFETSEEVFIEFAKSINLNLDYEKISKSGIRVS